MEDELAQVLAVNENAGRREREERRQMDKGDRRDRKTDRDQVGRKTGESPGEKTRRRVKGRWRWEERQQEQTMAEGRAGRRERER